MNKYLKLTLIIIAALLALYIVAIIVGIIGFNYVWSNIQGGGGG